MRFPNPIKFFSSMLAALKNWTRGHPLLTDAPTREARRRVCYSKTEECYDYRLDQCNECTCNVRLKTTFAAESCPRKFWGRSWKVVEI